MDQPGIDCDPNERRDPCQDFEPQSRGNDPTPGDSITVSITVRAYCQLTPASIRTISSGLRPAVVPQTHHSSSSFFSVDWNIDLGVIHFVLSVHSGCAVELDRRHAYQLITSQPCDPVHYGPVCFRERAVVAHVSRHREFRITDGLVSDYPLGRKCGRHHDPGVETQQMRRRHTRSILCNTKEDQFTRQPPGLGPLLELLPQRVADRFVGADVSNERNVEPRHSLYSGLGQLERLVE